MMTRFWSRWLTVAAVVVMTFDLALVLAAGSMQRVFEALYFTSHTGASLAGDTAAYAAFLEGVLGAVMIGWAAGLLWIVAGPFRRGETWAWTALTVSIVAWFVPDTAFSLWTGYWQNAVLNAVILLAFAIPLWATYRRFRSATHLASASRGAAQQP
jgi:hypothetical protein